jgi:DNA repair protein RecO (recombination protein O)
MIHKTKGIFFKQVPYSETSVITSIYTREFGLKSFIIKGAKSKKASIKSGLFHPCALLDLVVHLNDKTTLHFIKEARLLSSDSLINVDLPKLSVRFFLSEIFSKSIKEEEANPYLFDFLESTLEYLESIDKGLGVFPSEVLINLTTYLGFDVHSGLISGGLEEELGPVSKEVDALIRHLATRPKGQTPTIQYSKELKKDLLHILLKYYNVHIPKFGEPKTLKVLEQIL